MLSGADEDERVALGVLEVVFVGEGQWERGAFFFGEEEPGVAGGLVGAGEALEVVTDMEEEAFVFDFAEVEGLARGDVGVDDLGLGLEVGAFEEAGGDEDFDVGDLDGAPEKQREGGVAGEGLFAQTRMSVPPCYSRMSVAPGLIGMSVPPGRPVPIYQGDDAKQGPGGNEGEGLADVVIGEERHHKGAGEGPGDQGECEGGLG